MMKRILIIEDAKDLRDDVVEMLNLEGYDAIGAENGRLGVDAARRFHPDLIVCDIMMPEMDGYGVLEEIRSSPNTAIIPFIFLTAKTDRVNQRHGMVLGADDYLTKPFLVSELLESIRTQLQKREELNASANMRLEDLRESIITALPHELRTPLNTIIGFSDMMSMEAQRLKPDQIADWSMHINAAAHRLLRLIENYLYYVRMQVALNSPEAADDYATARLDNPRGLIESQAMKISQKVGRDADLTLDIEDSPPLRISHQDLIKIVDELVDNAFKFSEPDSAVSVQGRADKNGGYRLSIQDHGRGISAHEIASIGAYMQFNRMLYEQQGMGLGLAIVKRLMELYDGSFDIQGTDAGTRVEVGLQAAV